MPASVRLATAADLPTLLDLMHEFYAESGYPLDRATAARGFTTLIERPEYGALWLLLDDAVPAGYVVLTVRFGMEHSGMEGYIDDLFVRKSNRRHGLARAGLKALFAECSARTIHAVHVIVGPDNPAALNLYRGFGLTEPADGRMTLSVCTGQ